MKPISIISATILILSTACGQSSSDSTATDDNTATIEKQQDTNSTPKSNVIVSDWPPSETLIATDLISRSITEGTENGYYDPDWTFDIESGDISVLKVSEVLTQTESKYLVVVDMKLSKGGNYYYQTKARVNYFKSPEDGIPVLDYVTSLGMSIVSDGEYDNDIVPIVKELARPYLVLKNKCDVALTVGGKVLADSGWKKFCVTVPGQDSEEVPYWISDYRIDFVIRDY